jgi:hypothetical protein
MNDIANSTDYQATGDEIFTIISELEPILVTKPIPHIIMACLTIVLTLMNPDLTPEELTQGIRGCSQWVCEYMNTTEAALAITQQEAAATPPIGN